VSTQATNGPITPAQFDQNVGQKGAAEAFSLVAGYDEAYDGTLSSDGIEVLLFQFAMPVFADSFAAAEPTSGFITDLDHTQGTMPGIPGSLLVDSTKAGSDGYYVHQVLAQKGNYVFGLEYHTETAGPLQWTECRQSHTASECQLGDMPRVRVTTAHRHFRSHYGNWPFHGHMWVARGNWSN
jgi:hypothetical protein